MADDRPPPTVPDPKSSFDAGLTSVHVARAASGDDESLTWIVARFTPLLALQAQHRLQGPLRRLHDPDDLVNDVWVRVLPHLSDLEARDGRWTPVLMKYLSTTLARQINNLARKHLKGKPLLQEGPAGQDSTAASPVDELSAQISGVLTRVNRNEVRRAIEECLLALDDKDREILVLRGIEQLGNGAAAALLHEKEATVSQRYRRALEKLRRMLPRSIFDELDSGG